MAVAIAAVDAERDRRAWCSLAAAICLRISGPDPCFLELSCAWHGQQRRPARRGAGLRSRRGVIDIASASGLPGRPQMSPPGIPWSSVICNPFEREAFEQPHNRPADGLEARLGKFRRLGCEGDGRPRSPALPASAVSASGSRQRTRLQSRVKRSYTLARPPPRRGAARRY